MPAFMITLIILMNCVLKGDVSRQSSSFCLIVPITRPQSLWNIKAKKLQVNDKIRDPRQTNVSWALFLKLQAAGSTLKTVRLNSFQKPLF